jgi:hypothetical protein
MPGPITYLQGILQHRQQPDRRIDERGAHYRRRYALRQLMHFAAAFTDRQQQFGRHGAIDCQ